MSSDARTTWCSVSWAASWTGRGVARANMGWVAIVATRILKMCMVFCILLIRNRDEIFELLGFVSVYLISYLMFVLALFKE